MMGKAKQASKKPDKSDPDPTEIWMHALVDETEDASDTSVKSSLPNNTMGLALSGGGIRSASFCLGVIQSMARHRWLRHVDFMSTVSGGGYTGSFLGRFFDQQRALDDADTEGAAQDRIAAALSDSRSDEINWLRRHSNFLSPTGFGEAMFNFAAFWRNFLSLHFVLGVFFFALFGIANAIRYWLIPVPITDLWIDRVAWLAPITTGFFGAAITTWIVAVEATIWLAALPLAISYWMVSQDENETLVLPVLLSALIASIGALIAFAHPHALVVLCASILWAYATWYGIEKVHGHIDPRSPFRRGLSRNRLTYRLAFWTTVLVALAALAVIDALGLKLALLVIDSDEPWNEVKTEISVAMAGLLALAPIMRGIAGLLARSDEAGGGVLSSLGKIPYVPTVLALALVGGIPLVVLAFLSHLSYEAGYGIAMGLVATAGAILISWLLGRQSAIQFVNRVGPLTIYAARLARVFLGAANPRRKRRRSGKSVTEVIEGDDVPFDQYSPHATGGPLHLINVAVNETVDVASQRSMRDRQAENMAVGPGGISLSKSWHALWKTKQRHQTGLPLVPIGNVNQPHPFRQKDKSPALTERLTVRQWMAISGAAASPGMGRLTSSAVSLILTLANVRLGYWWNSGIWSGERANLPIKTNLWTWVKNLFMRLFAAQGLLVSELRGQFGGPWRRHFYLSDGGNFENTATYELIRRRVPLIITCDAGRDHKQQLGGLAELTRIARIDFGAEIQECVKEDLQENLPQHVVDALGPSAKLLADPPDSGSSPYQATLLRIEYPQEPHLPADQLSPWHHRRESWMLYIKATYSGDEPADLRNYKAKNPDFPNESTIDQFFDEPQWESYRKLGEFIGEKLFRPDPSAAES